MSLVREFRDFAVRGNVVDLAVAVIIGVAFGKIISSLVADIIMPLVGVVVGVNYENLYLQVGEAKILYGKFIQNVVDFFIIALVIFFMVLLINRFRHKGEAKPPQEQLLEEIRDLLKRNR